MSDIGMRLQYLSSLSGVANKKSLRHSNSPTWQRYRPSQPFFLFPTTYPYNPYPPPPAPLYPLTISPPLHVGNKGVRSIVQNGTDDIHPYSRFPAFHSMSIFVASEREAEHRQLRGTRLSAHCWKNPR